MQRVIRLAEGQPKCISLKCSQRHTCARAQVPMTMGRPLEDFTQRGLWQDGRCISYISVSDACREIKHERPAHECPEGLQ